MPRLHFRNLSCQFGGVQTDCLENSFNTVLRLLQILQAGATIEHVKRGGELTFHGPGQLVAYPIYALRCLGMGPRAFVKQLEDCMIASVGAWGLHATGDPACAAGVCFPCS
jgi:lipoate-protein ligase B